MTVLARELDAYQRALDTYKRQAGSYNRQQDAYQNSFLKDASGNIYLVQDGSGFIGGPNIFTAPPEGGTLSPTSLPRGSLADYATQPTPEASGFSMLRDPTKDPKAKRQTIAGVVPLTTTAWGESGNYEEPTGEYRTPQGESLDRSWQVTQATPGRYVKDPNSWNPFDEGTYVPPTYQATRWDPASFTQDPGAWTKTQPKGPEATIADVRKLGRASLAAQEGGLISDVIRTR